MRLVHLLTLLTMLLGGLVGVAMSQTYTDRQGSIVQPYVGIPFPWIPLSPGQHGLAPTSSTALTIPSGARMATICASTAVVRYTTDGTTAPTSTVGMPIQQNTCIQLTGPLVLYNFRMLSATGTVDVEYFQ